MSERIASDGSGACLFDMVRRTWPAVPGMDARRQLLRLHQRIADPALTDPGEGLDVLLAGLPRAWCERDDTGRLTGIAGLGRRPGLHRIVEGAPGCFGWCAWDLLFLPAVLGRTLVAESRCPVTDRAVTLTVAPGRIVQVAPATAMMAFMSVDTARFTQDLRAAFCAHVRLCADSASAEHHARRVSGRCVIDLQTAFALGVERNRAVFGGDPARLM